MTRKEIEKIQVVQLSYFDNQREEMWYKIGCIDGLEAADAEPNLEMFWHDSNEEPKEEGWILIQFGAVYYTLLMPRDIYVWQDFVNIQYSVQWAYISDLLQKGGEK